MEKAFKIIGIALVLVMVVGVLSTQARTKQKRRAVKKERIIKKNVKKMIIFPENFCELD